MNPQVARLPLIASTNSYNLAIPDEVEFKIREWCRLNPTTEWSGTLFYTTEGSFENNDIKFTARDFFVMDIGTAGFTNYKETPEICSYMMDNDLLDCKTGLIHSHNNMKAFFSGTDASTLSEEGEATTHFLSLIVNNEGTYVARVTRKVTETIEGVKHFKYLTFNGEEVNCTENVKIEGRTYIQYFDLNILVNNPYLEIKKYISDRYSELKTAKTAAAIKSNIAEVNKKYLGDFEYKSPNYKSALSPVKETIVETPVFKKEPTLFEEEDSSEFISNKAQEHVAQLIYGNMILTSDSFKKFTKVNEWITTNMEKAYDKRFGQNTEEFTAYQDWMYQFCDSVVWGAANDLVYNGDAVELEDGAAVIATAMIKYLREIVIKAYDQSDYSSCKINNYLSYIMECLESYINE